MTARERLQIKRTIRRLERELFESGCCCIGWDEERLRALEELRATLKENS